MDDAGRTGRRLGAEIIVLGGWMACSSLAGWWLHRSLAPPDPRRRTAVVVLGYPSRRSGGPHPVQRWRMRAAARTLRRQPDSWLIVSGGPTRGTESEAAVMARYAVARLHVDPGRIELEQTACSTWDNVRCSVPLARRGAAERLAFVSHPFHVERARQYLLRQEPDLAPDVVRAAGVRPFEWFWAAPLMHLDHVARRARDRHQTTAAVPGRPGTTEERHPGAR